MKRVQTLRHKLLHKTPIFGLFTRLADPEVVEALAASALDFVVLDVEHGSLGRADVNRIVATARAHDLPVIVRVPGVVLTDIHHAIAVGASGIVVPHVSGGDEAKAIADFARSAGLERAYAGMGRAADYRRSGWPAFQEAAREQFVVIAQIDDATGAVAAQGIARTNGIDAVFVGSLSLALSLGEPDPRSAAVDDVIKGICDACVSAGRRIGIHVLNAAEHAIWVDRGVNLFVIGNDLNLLRQGADRAVALFRDAR